MPGLTAVRMPRVEYPIVGSDLVLVENRSGSDGAHGKKGICTVELGFVVVQPSLVQALGLSDQLLAPLDYTTTCVVVVFAVVMGNCIIVFKYYNNYLCFVFKAPYAFLRCLRRSCPNKAGRRGRPRRDRESGRERRVATSACTPPRRATVCLPVLPRTASRRSHPGVCAFKKRRLVGQAAYW